MMAKRTPIDSAAKDYEGGADNYPIKPMRPLAPLYRPGERFDISAAGLQAWYRSESFKRVGDFYAFYPSRSILSDNGRALLHHLIVMRRPALRSGRNVELADAP
jgi:hypothetical protein